jgi:DNA (cytosine-5)-methyltransferase 1
MRVLSLFSGVGGFDMGLEAAGMTTVFQCEIDKHARSVLDYHWPDTPKWDDVSTLTGAHILEVTGGVDVVAWGSPCQDLSLAGKRAGLSGERSGLFHEGIRIIKELRELSNGKYPTWSIWENVVGALSSNRGADFGEVLYEMDEAGACFSEWTVLDAQYFGVPQRRRRVFVTSCFDPATSERCGSPLFPVCESVSGDSEKGGKKRKGATRSTQDRIGTSGQWAAGSNTDGVLTTSVTSKWYKGTGGPSGSEHYNLVVEPTTFVKSRRAQSVNDHETWVESDVTPTLNVFDIGDVRATTAIIEPVAYKFDSLSSNSMKSPNPNSGCNEVDVSSTLDTWTPDPSLNQGGIAIVDATPIQDGREIEKHQNGLGIGKEGDPMYTLDQTGGQAVAYSIREDATANNFSATEIETARALQALQPSVQSHHAQTFITQPILLDGRRVDDVRVYTEPVQTLQERMGTGGNNVPVVAQDSVIGSLAARDYKGVGNQYVAENKLVIQDHTPTLIVRRLTPLECERLMGWPDNHTAQSTNGSISDTQRYKMCGNGVASPVATWIAKHILANGT